ncbi:MAG: helix-turn-helix transcriptional regulator [Clostridiaceae bacterium]|nr:helix-turn-helix transcriptional regulator [Clostridiaceae bacterium]
MTKARTSFKSEKCPLGIEILKNLYLLGKTQNWLAERVGVSPAHISWIISGRVMPRQPILKKISEELNVKPEELVKHLF